MTLSHTDESGKARMVDVSEKEITKRRAVARGRVTMKPETLAMIRENRVKKGDVLATARIAAIMAAKRTDGIIPLCHPIPITDVSVDFEIDEPEPSVVITVTVSAIWRTGVEMEAIVGVLAAAATDLRHDQGRRSRRRHHRRRSDRKDAAARAEPTPGRSDMSETGQDHLRQYIEDNRHKEGPDRQRESSSRSTASVTTPTRARITARSASWPRRASIR